MNTNDFLRLGVPLGQATRLATDFVAKFVLGGGNKLRLHEEVVAILANPSAFLGDDLRKDFAKALLNAPPPPRAEPVKYHQWGEGLDHEAVMQMEKACLLGQYAAANHLCIHRHIAEHLGAQVLLDLENHHNFAWKERHVIGGVEREVIVHRKGATPAGAGVLGIIPGSMATPGFVVSGKGNAESLNSASHGAGRTMSRKSANEKFNWKDVNRFLKQQGVTLISAGLDEVPMAYKNIREVMAAQKDLVTMLGEFTPKLVKMAPSGERPED
jgi:RNA-splicing ligase RtcB